MICISYVGLVVGYLLVGLTIAVILLNETWRFVIKHQDPSDSMTPQAYHRVIFVGNTLFWPVIVYVCLKDPESDGSSASAKKTPN